MKNLDTREEIALEITQDNSFEKTIEAMNKAILECKQEGKQPISDPAIGVIVAKMQTFFELGGFNKTAALLKCREKQSIRLQKPRLIQIAEKPIGYNAERKNEFHNEAKKQLEKLAKYLGYKKEDYTLSVNMGGIAASGETILHTEHIYIEVFQGIGSIGDVMYRRVDSRQDTTGKRNNFAYLRDLNDLKAFARKVHHRLNDDDMPLLPDETIDFLL